MAGKSTISITFKIDGDSKGFKDLAGDAEGLKAVIQSTVVEAEQLKGKFINFAALATGIEAVSNSFGQLQQGMQGLADAYAVQEVGERKLATIMAQRMNATEEEIQAIKDLASAQQAIGVIGDEVQLSGAQQIATFLNEKESLEALIPAMNNLLAQQKGLTASTSDAVSVGNLMGKAMMGQVDSLKEVGITFTQAEANVIKFGTEQERAAMVAQVIANNVGEMNAQLALTDSGKQQQLVNTLGDMKEELGELVNGALPFVTITAQTGQALAAVTTLVSGFKTLTTTVYTSVKAFAMSTAVYIKNKAAILATATAQKIVAAATMAWTAVQKVLNVVLTMNPIGLVIAAIGALVAAVVAAYNNFEGFRKIVDAVWEGIKPLAVAIMDGLAKAFEWLVEKCKEAWEWLKNILGLGNKTVEIAVDVSKPKKAPAIDLESTKKKYENAGIGGITAPKVDAAVWKEDAANLKEIGDNIQILETQLQTASQAEAALINQQIAAWNEKADVIKNAGKAVENNGPIWRADAANLKEISDNIRILEDQLQVATLDEAALINQQIAAWNEKADAIKNAGKAAEESSITTSKALTDSWGGIKNIGSSIQGITGALQGNGNAWQTVVGIVDGFLGLYQGINAVVGIINMLTAASAAHAATKTVEAGTETATAVARATAATTTAASSVAVITANKLEAASFKELAAAEYMAAHAYIPFAGFGIAMGFTTAMMAAVTAAGIPALAEGGVASGPTLALVGEYAGASGNPEVIAPLDKLRGMLAETGGGYGGEVEFKIKGRTLVGILAKENNLTKRS